MASLIRQLGQHGFVLNGPNCYTWTSREAQVTYTLSLMCCHSCVLHVWQLLCYRSTRMSEYLHILSQLLERSALRAKLGLLTACI